MKNMVNSEIMQSLMQDVTEFLYQLVTIPSVANDETAACDYCYRMFAQIPGISLEKIPMDNALMNHPLWCSGPYPHPGYNGQYNIEAVWKGTGEQEPIYFNAHIDTIEACDPGLLHPRLEDGVLYGLGACDDKGQIAVMYAMLKYLSAQNLRLPFDVVCHVVVEEEIGGNGALAITNRPLKGQAAVVMEASEGNIYPAHRGGIWLKITCYGVSCHPAAFSGGGKPASAYDRIERAIAIVQQLHEDYRAECRANPVRYYEGYEPPFNLGMVHAGNWPATVPTEATADMLFAVLPNYRHAEMRARIEAALSADEELKGNFRVDYIFDRESSVLEFDHPMVLELQACMRRKGYPGNIESMKCVDDKFFYQEVLGFPTVTVGAGRLVNAHSATEQVPMQEVLDIAEIMLSWLCLRAEKESKK